MLWGEVCPGIKWTNIRKVSEDDSNIMVVVSVLERGENADDRGGSLGQASRPASVPPTLSHNA